MLFALVKWLHSQPSRAGRPAGLVALLHQVLDSGRSATRHPDVMAFASARLAESLLDLSGERLDADAVEDV